MNLGIRGKVALVTGAGRGLGNAICKSLADEGAHIVACSKTEDSLRDLLEMLPNSGIHKYFVVDFACVSDVESLLRNLEAEGIQPDILINNVGGNLDFTDPLSGIIEWQQVVRLNVEVAIQMNQALIPSMINKGWGRVCHISSISALENQGPPAYCAAKAALNAYVRSLARYVSKHNVILTTVMPGAIFTEGGYWDIAMNERPDHVAAYLKDRMAIQRFGSVEEISHAVSFLCSNHSSFCVGSNLLIDGGQGRVFYNQGEVL
jgi:3-oxoacyl-[acyl-carrier protein] reductase